MNLQTNQAIHFFREAAPYIASHRKKTFVIAFKGSLIKHESFQQAIQDIAILSTLGVRVILVHGARPQIDEQLIAQNIPINMHKGMRVTDRDTINATKKAVGAIRIEFENAVSHILNTSPLVNQGLGIVSGNFITAQPIGIEDGVDYLYTGKVRKINYELIKVLLKKESMILLSPIGYSPTGEAYNLRYKHVAISTAKAVKADKVIFLDDVDFDLPNTITLETVEKQAKAHPEYAPLLGDITYALNEGVERIHLLNAKIANSLLLELYTRDGVGKMITATHYEKVRPATIDDVSGILELIRPLEQKKILVKRSREQLELEINNFIVIDRESTIIGCAACYTIDQTDMGELACLATHPEYRSRNLGDKLLNYISELALGKQINSILVLTTQTTDWFRERGFELSSVDDLPDVRKAQYNYQRNSKVLIKKI